MNRAIKWSIFAAIAAVIGGGWYYKSLPKGEGELAEGSENIEKIVQKGKVGRANGNLHINATIIKHELLVDEFSTTGVLIPDEMVDLKFESSGKVVEINFVEGSHVKQGDLLARINDSKLRAQKLRLTTQLKLAQDRVYRQEQLLERDAVSREALEEVQTDLAMLKADIDIIDANIELTELRAPFDGVIGLRHISLGAYANSNTTVVATLVKNSPIKVEFAIPERYATSIGKGTNLTFSVDGNLDKFKAKVYAAESSIDASLHQFSLRAIHPNADGRLMAGSFALVEITKDEIHDAIAVPAECIVPEMGKDKVFLYRGGKAEPVEILAGIRSEGRVQVLRGLSLGDTLIVSGTLQLRTGIDVVIDNFE